MVTQRSLSFTPAEVDLDLQMGIRDRGHDNSIRFISHLAQIAAYTIVALLLLMKVPDLHQTADGAVGVLADAAHIPCADTTWVLSSHDTSCVRA